MTLFAVDPASVTVPEVEGVTAGVARIAVVDVNRPGRVDESGIPVVYVERTAAALVAGISAIKVNRPIPCQPLAGGRDK